MIVYEVLGSIGTAIRCVLLIPPIYKVTQIKSGEALSYTSLLLQSLSSFLILTYGIGINKYLIIIRNVLALIASMILIGLKYHYYKRGMLTNMLESSL